MASTACTSSSASLSLDPPHLRIDSIETTGGSPWTRGGSQDCVQFGADPHRTLAVGVGPNDGAGHLLSPGVTPVSWTLSPPLTCTGTPPCGYLVLTVDSCVTGDPATCSDSGASNVAPVASAGPSIPVEMGNNSDGWYRFHVELYNPDASHASDSTGKPYPAEAMVQVLSECASLPSPPLDGGKPLVDAGRDASRPDTGVPPDVAPRDATPGVDTGAPHLDAGPPRDASSDAALPDASRPLDASRPRDATLPIDARPPPPTDARPQG